MAAVRCHFRIKSRICCCLRVNSIILYIHTVYHRCRVSRLNDGGKAAGSAGAAPRFQLNRWSHGPDAPFLGPEAARSAAGEEFFPANAPKTWGVFDEGCQRQGALRWQGEGPETASQPLPGGESRPDAAPSSPDGARSGPDRISILCQ